MNIHKIDYTMKMNFTGKIIDSHTHIGQHEGINYTKQDLDVFVSTNLPNQDIVEKIIVSDLDVLHGIKDEFKGNSDTINIMKNDKRYSILISCNPKDGNINEIERLYQAYEGNFAGLKFHPQIQNLELSDSRYKPYFEFAEKHNLPCLIHTEVNLLDGGILSKDINKLSDPEIIYSAAKKYPSVPFVMAHMGAGYNEAHDKAVDVLIESIRKGDANLFADISWVDIDAENKEHILKAIKRLKGIGEKDWTFGDQSYRLMFGSDAPLARFKISNGNDPITNYIKFIDDIKTAIRNDKDLCTESEKIIDDLFYNNANKLYFNDLNKSGKKNFLIIAVCSIAAALSGIGAAVYKTKHDNISK